MNIYKQIGIATAVLTATSIAQAQLATPPKVRFATVRCEENCAVYDVGSTVPTKEIVAVYFLDSDCPLPVEGAGDMYRAALNLTVAQISPGGWRKACWGSVFGGGMLTIDATGYESRSQFSIENYSEGLLNPDDSVTVTRLGFIQAQVIANAKAKARQNAEPAPPPRGNDAVIRNLPPEHWCFDKENAYKAEHCDSESTK